MTGLGLGPTAHTESQALFTALCLYKKEPKARFLGLENYVQVSSVTSQNLMPELLVPGPSTAMKRQLLAFGPGTDRAGGPGCQHVGSREKEDDTELYLMLLKAPHIVFIIPNGATSFYRPSPFFRHLARNLWGKEKGLQNRSPPGHAKEAHCDQELEWRGKDTLALPPKPSGACDHPQNMGTSCFRGTWIVYCFHLFGPS